MTIRLFDVSGRVVRVLERGARTPGVHAVIWDGRDDRGGSVANGVYFCLMQAGPFRATRRLVLIH